MRVSARDQNGISSYQMVPNDMVTMHPFTITDYP